MTSTNPFGTVLRTATTTGVPRALNQSAIPLDLFCDGYSSPNPGQSEIIVHDGSNFIYARSRTGGNHTAVYGAVVEALEHAVHLGATEVTISLLSKLVWGQITGNRGVDELTQDLARARAKASRIATVHWALLAPPLTVGMREFRTAQAFRRFALVQPAVPMSAPQAIRPALPTTAALPSHGGGTGP
jgi:hypothetical protein